MILVNSTPFQSKDRLTRSQPRAGGDSLPVSLELWVNDSVAVFLREAALSNRHAPSFLEKNLTHSSNLSCWGQEPPLATGNGWSGQVLS